MCADVLSPTQYVPLTQAPKSIQMPQVALTTTCPPPSDTFTTPHCAPAPPIFLVAACRSWICLYVTSADNYGSSRTHARANSTGFRTRTVCPCVTRAPPSHRFATAFAWVCSGTVFSTATCALAASVSRSSTPGVLASSLRESWRSCWKQAQLRSG